MSPRFVFIVDNVCRHIVANSAEIGLDPRDQAIVFVSGLFEDVKTFFSSHSSLYKEVEVFFFLWIGAYEIAQPIPPGDWGPTVEKWRLPDGPNTMPKMLAVELASSYADLLRHSLERFPPSANVFSSNAAPQRSQGWSIVRAAHGGEMMGKNPPEDVRHHHATFGKPFVIRLSGEGEKEKGGKYPLREQFFESGVTATTNTLSLLLFRAYATITAVREPSAVNQPMREALKYVRIWF